MTPQLAQIWRHPIKAIGREQLETVTLTAGDWMPFDRLWAVSHDRARLDGGWDKKVNFLRGSTDPNLMAVTAELNEATGEITLTHPTEGHVTFHPDQDRTSFLDWINRVWSPDLPRPTGLYRAAQAHLTDVPQPWIAIASLASLRALGQRMGQDLSPNRWRANLWVDGAAPWAEKDWVGQTIRIGAVTFQIECEITRCKATMANPETGRRDADILGALENLGHQEFGLYATVINDGSLTVGDPVQAP